VRQNLAASTTCDNWNATTTLNTSVVEVPPNTFTPNQTYVITLVVTAPGRSPSFDTQSVMYLSHDVFIQFITSVLGSIACIEQTRSILAEIACSVVCM